MPRPKGEPTKVVRLPVALLEPLEAEAHASGKPIADVLAARLDGPAASSAITVAARSAPGTTARGRTPKAAHAKPTRAVPVATGSRPTHLPTCRCAVCKPKGAKR